MTGQRALRALVLGGTGFVGRQVCAALDAAGWAVTSAARNAPPPAPWASTTLDLTVASPEAIATLLNTARVDVVVNTVGSIWGAADAEMVTRCTVPTQRLIAGLRLAHRPPRLVQLGSVLEYGPVPPGASVAAAVGPPVTAYGQAKLAATEAVLTAAAAGDVTALVLRVSNVAGPGAPRISLLGQVAAQLVAARDRAPVDITLDRLRGHRDYVDVRDVADAVVAAAGSSESGQLADIGRGEAVSVRSLVETLIDVSGIDARIVVRDDEPVAGQPVDWLRVDIEPAAALLGWRPRRSLRDAIRAFWLEIMSRETVSPETA